MKNQHLIRILTVSRYARDNDNVGVLSTGEGLCAALVLNRHDWLSAAGYTIAEAMERIGPEWLSQIPAAARTLREEG